MRKFLRNVWSVLYWISMLVVSVQYFTGRADTLCKVAFWMNAVGIVVNVILTLNLKKIDNQLYKNLKVEYDYLKYVHKERYKAYFSDSVSQENIAIYSREIDRIGKAVIYNCKWLAEKPRTSKQRKQEIQDIISKTEKLMTTVRTPL